MSISVLPLTQAPVWPKKSFMDTANGIGLGPQVNLPFGDMERFAPLLLAAGVGAEVGLDARSLEETPEPVFREWAGRLAHLEVTAHGPFMDLAPGGVDPGVVEVTRQRLLKAAGAAALFSARDMVCHAGYDVNRYPHNLERWLDTSARTWELVLEATEASGMRICLENVYETGPQMLVRLVDRLDHPRLGVCFDAGHFNAWGRGDLDDWLDALGPRIMRLHLHDNDGSFDDHLPIGRGSFPFRRLMDGLHRLGVRPGITLEPHTEEDFGPMAAGLRELLEYRSGLETV